MYVYLPGVLNVWVNWVPLGSVPLERLLKCSGPVTSTLWPPSTTFHVTLSPVLIVGLFSGALELKLSFQLMVADWPRAVPATAMAATRERQRIAIGRGRMPRKVPAARPRHVRAHVGHSSSHPHRRGNEDIDGGGDGDV